MGLESEEAREAEAAMPHKLKHLTWAHEFLSGTRVTYCRKRVPEADSVDRGRKDELDLVTCKGCIAERDAENRWHAHFVSELAAREARGEPEARWRAWLATTGVLGANPRGFPTPKREVNIHYSRGEDGRGRWEVAAPKGARLAFGPHAKAFATRDEAERAKLEVKLERCPEDCECGYGKPLPAEEPKGTVTT